MCSYPSSVRRINILPVGQMKLLQDHSERQLEYQSQSPLTGYNCLNLPGFMQNLTQRVYFRLDLTASAANVLLISPRDLSLGV